MFQNYDFNLLGMVFSIHDTKLASPTNSVAICMVHSKVDIASLATFESGTCFIPDNRLDLVNSVATVAMQKLLHLQTIKN